MQKKEIITAVIFGFLVLVPSVLSAATKLEVEIEDFAFIPQNITIQVGDTVEWKNRDAVGHSSTSGKDGVADGMWESGILQQDQRYSYVFNTEGVYAYFCRPHTWMTGTVTVESRPDTSDTTSPAIIEKYEFTPLGLEITSSSIIFSLPTSGKTRLTLYDLTGSQIAVLADGFYSTGRYDMQRPTLSPGVYFVKLIFEDNFLTRKLIKVM